MPSTLFFLASVLVGMATTIHAQAVFAHMIVGNNGGWTIGDWTSDIQLASECGIDAFVLNIATPLAGTTAEQINLAFQAASILNNGFKLLFSFDYLGGAGPWITQDILTLLNEYSGNQTYYHYEGKSFISTFEGPTNSDVTQWSTIRSSMPNGIYFVPDWTSQGPGFNIDLIDGAFSWDMWPNGPENMTTQPDEAWQGSLKPAGKSYMMGVSPWFYTNLPAYSKAWVWRGDSLWYDRWQEALNVKPDFVEIVTWNDFGESHYIGPIHESSIPQSSGADARPYVDGMAHEAWLQTLPFQIAAYKHAVNPSNPAPAVKAGDDKVVYWFRTTPVAVSEALLPGVTGNCAKSAINTGGYQTGYPPSEILEDEVFAIALLSQPDTVSVSIGNSYVQSFNLAAGLSFIHFPFNGQTGMLAVRSTNGLQGSGQSVESQPSNGTGNFNAWVGVATS